MTSAARRAFAFGVALGAHPSYPDRAEFGRRSLAIEGPVLVTSLVEQIAALRAIALRCRGRLSHVKPHGALYNDAHHDVSRAAQIASAVRAVDAGLAVVCASTSALARAAKEAGLRVIAEAFADRRYRRDGSLVPRGEARAVIEDVTAAATQAVEIVLRGRAFTVDGVAVAIRAETLCLHGDTPGAGTRLRAIRAALEGAGITIRSPVR